MTSTFFIDNYIPIYTLILVIFVVVAVIFKNRTEALSSLLAKQKLKTNDYQNLLKSTEEMDVTTGLYNRLGFSFYTKKMLLEHPNTTYVLVRADIDNFKIYNDLYGTAAGDKLLWAIGGLFKEKISSNTTCGRFEADHFVFCCPKSRLDMEELLSITNLWFDQYPSDFKFNCRFGIYIIDDSSLDIERMCDRALMVLKTVKGIYNKQYAFYDEDLRKQMMIEQDLVAQMVTALETGQFELYFQPQFNHNTGRLIGSEALVRWNHPEKGLVPPTMFIPLFEKNGFITSLDEYVWEEACKALRKWLDSQPPLSVMPVSVNISRLDIYRENLCDFFISLLKKYDLPASLLRLEITESAYVENPGQLIGVVAGLQSAGFTIEMDDFGSGYSSLNTLMDFPVDVLKMDLRFLNGQNEERGGNIISSVIRMAKWLDMTVIAEGVETKNQADYLLGLGCQYMQGFYYAKPMPMADFEALLAREPSESATLVTRTEKYLHLDIWNHDSQFSILFNTSEEGQAIAEYSPEGLEIVRANRSFYSEIPASKELYASLQKNVLSRFYDSYRTLFTEMIDKAIITKETVEFETCSKPLTPNGRDFWVRTKLYVLLENNGNYLLHLTVKNVTRNKKITDNIDSLTSSLSSGLAICSIKDDNLTFLHCNDTVANIFGYSLQNFLEKDLSFFLNLLYREDKLVAESSIKALLDGSTKNTSLTCRFLHADGSMRWVHVTSSVFKEGSEETILCTSFLDVTQHMIDVSENTLNKYAPTLFETFDQLYSFDFTNQTFIPIHSNVLRQNQLGQALPLRQLREEWKNKTIAPSDVSSLFVMEHASPEDIHIAKDFVASVTKGVAKTSSVLRIKSSNNSYCWNAVTQYTEKDGTRALLAFVDINNEVQGAITGTLEQLNKTALWKDAIYRLLAENTNSVTFDYDPLNDLMSYTTNIVGKSPVSKKVSNYMAILPNFKATVVHQDYIASYVETLRQACTVKDKGSFEYLANHYDEGFNWCRAHWISMKDEAGIIYHVVGRVDDIHEEKRRESVLRKKAEYDVITGLLNRETVQTRINDAILNKNNPVQMLFVLLDLDDFKTINDTYGHLKGDEVLKHFSQLLKIGFRKNDIKGRLGGDEFVLFIKDLSLNMAIKKLDTLQEKLNNLCNINIETKLSASIGIYKVTPECTGFNYAYQKADEAMYTAKKEGKNSIVVYN